MSHPLSTLRAVDLTYRYQTDKPCVESVSLQLESGKLHCLTGLSGSGKSTLARLLCGALEPESGEIILQEEGGEKRVKESERINLIGMVEAHPEVQLFADSVREELEFGLKNRKLTRAEIETRVAETCRAIGLDEQAYGARHPLSLSGGERRMVAIGVYVALQFRFYIFDEPTAGLDWRARQRFSKVIETLLAAGSGVLWITHDEELLEGLDYGLVQMLDGVVR